MTPLTGHWIAPADDTVGAVLHPAHHLVGELDLPGAVRSATLRATAHGLYEPYVNGERATDLELLPGFTAYASRLQVHTFDVTHLMRPGRNAVGFLLSSGWWRGQGGGITRIVDASGSTTAVLAELRVELLTGEVVVRTTDSSWRSCASHILSADLIAGEVHDQRLRVPGWAEPGQDRQQWDRVSVEEHSTDCLVPAEGPPVRRIEELAAVSVHELSPGRHVVDFGQNSNGWVRLADLGPAGSTLTVVYGEMLDENGDLTQANIAESKREDVPFQTDVVTSAGDGAVFEPRHSTKGFRYVRVEGHPGLLDPESIVSVVVHSDLRRVGGFSCSDERLNRLHLAADWSFRGNACDIPTDCPHRERAGWTGDWQVFIEAAALLYDVYDFSARWLKDLAADQWDDGTVLNLVPEQHDLTQPEHAAWRYAQGSSGWGDAACHVPWELYLASGNSDVLAAQLDSMTRWVDRCARMAADGRHPDRAADRPDPLPHERYLWDTGFHFGEWTEPDAGTGVLARIMAMDHGPTATAFLHRSARELAAAAAVLGDAALSQRAARLATEAQQAWQKEFIGADGHLQPQRQANLVRALAFGLVPDELVQVVVEDLVELIREAGTHLGTGFLATPFLLPVLADHGRLDVAYELLLQDTEPSWLYMIDQGATTVWEDWSGRASLNHYSKGAVISFLHRYVAGLQRVEPGYRRFRVQPRPGGGITKAETWLESPHGRIEVRWGLVDGRGELRVTVPEGTSAELVLPDGQVHTLAPGTYDRTWASTPEGEQT